MTNSCITSNPCEYVSTKKSVFEEKQQKNGLDSCHDTTQLMLGLKGKKSPNLKNHD